MDDHLALLVGRVILAWGRLDQQLHLFIIAMERAVGTPHLREGRFSERRKIFRRLCMQLTAEPDTYKSAFDACAAQLVRLERMRGRIAHGMAGNNSELAIFLHFPTAFEGADIEKDIDESTFRYGALERLALDIEQCAKDMTSLALEALAAGKLAGRTVPQH